MVAAEQKLVDASLSVRLSRRDRGEIKPKLLSVNQSFYTASCLDSSPVP